MSEKRACGRRDRGSRVCWIVLVLLGMQAEGAGAAEAPPRFLPAAAVDLESLMRAVRDRAPALQPEHLETELRRADVRQSRLIENPVLDGAVATLPLGEPNPPELPDPLRNIPNYAIGVSVRPDLARRGARIERATLLLQAADAQRTFAVRGQALRLLRILGDLAVVTLRLEADVRLSVQAKSALSLAKDRVRTGFGPPLDADRAEMEVLRLEQQVSADQGELLAAQAACAEHVGVACGAFPDDAEARRFLAVWLQRGQAPSPPPESRADLQSLAAQQSSAQAEARLARAQRVPDPTVRLGYMYDTFVVSGNQRHSMSVSLSLPLPLVDYGQAGVQAAQARARRLGEQRRLSIVSAEAQIAALRLALGTQRQRLTTLQEQVVPRGQAILRDVRRAFEARAVPLTDLNQAQRALDELLLQEAMALADVFRLSVDLIELGGSHA